MTFKYIMYDISPVCLVPITFLNVYNVIHKNKIINLYEGMNMCMSEDEIMNASVIFSEESKDITFLTNVQP
jgi:hypothetical protein